MSFDVKPTGRWRRRVAAFLFALLIPILGCVSATAPEVGGSDAVPAASAPTTGIPTMTKLPTSATTMNVASTTATAPVTSVASTTTVAPTTSTQPRPERPPAPDFSGVTLSGEEISLWSCAGKPLILVFWWSG
jgi:hypothetical protein